LRVPRAVVATVLLTLGVIPAATPFLARTSHLPVLLLLQALTALVLPGWLAHAALRLPAAGRAERLLFAGLLSVLLLMLLGLLANSLLPLLGVDRPLAPTRLGPLLAAVNIILVGVLLRQGRPSALTVQLEVPSLGALLLYAAPVAIIAGTVAGAIRLNNHGSNAVAVATLIAVAAYFAAVLLAPRIPSGAFPASIFLISFALLLSLSLRGNVISGHDILVEYKAYLSTQSAYHWRPGGPTGAYSACLSITILPVYIHDLVWVSGQTVFRVIAQGIAALTPLAVFLAARRYLSDRLAYAAALFFVAQAPFLGDLPFLVRQEIAFAFFAGLVIVVLNPAPSRPRAIAFACLLAAGMVLAHYSTTYVAVAIFVAGLASLAAWRAAGTLVRGVRRSSVRVPRRLTALVPTLASIDVRSDRSIRHHLALPMTIFLLIAAGTWIAGVTHTSSNVSQFFSDISLPRTPSLSVLVAGHATTPNAAAYVRAIAGDAAPGARYARGIFAASSSVRAPKDTVGTHLPQAVARWTYTAASIVRDLVKLLLLGGALWLLAFRRRLNLRPDHAALIIGSVIVLLVGLVIPAVNSQYDAGRVYQQAVVVLSVAVVVGSMVAFRALRIPGVGRLAALVVLLSYLSVSPLGAEAIGSGYANLQLNNYGPYYEVYYVHGEEVRAIQWLARNGARSTPSYADWFATKKIVAFSPRQIWIIDNVVPANITRTSYVFSDYTNVVDGVADGNYQGSIVGYAFPRGMGEIKNLLFSTGDVKIFR
jgi:uncharacterized membrane protein